jgi:hypothetical protein
MSTTVVNKRTEPYDVYIGRPSKWGNPFSLEKFTREKAIELYGIMLSSRADLKKAAKEELRGKRLGCFCKPLACHGDILARVADEQ